MSSLFSIQAAAERSGLTPHVIRAWERRYRAVEPARSPGRQRFYSEAEVERLAMLGRAVRGGHAIGRIAGLPTDDLRRLMAKQPAMAGRVRAVGAEDDPALSFRTDALAAATQFDEPVLADALRRALLALGSQGLLSRVVAPLAHEIGQLWRAGEITAAHEHFFTASVKAFLGELTRQFATPLDAPRIVVATPSGQMHELGALMAATTAANLGWRPIYLGPSLPAHEIAGAALRNEAAAVALSLVFPEDDPALPRELTDLARLLPAGARLLVGGRAAHAYLDTLIRIGATCAESIEEFGTLLERVRRGAVPASRARPGQPRAAPRRSGRK